MEYLPKIDDVIKVYERLVEDEGNIDRGNLYIALLAGYAAVLWDAKLVGSSEISSYFEELRGRIMDGPDLLNPYVMELLSILAEGLSEANFEEFMSKLRMVLREDTLERLEL